MMHSDAYTLCNLDSQTYSTLPAPYHHQQHYQTTPGPAYLHQNDTNYFQHAADCFRGANWASCGATSGHVIDSASGESCIKRSRGSGGFYDGGTAAMVLYGHHPGVARPPGAAAFEFPFPGFCAGADVASSNTGSGCGYAAAAAAAAFYGVDSCENTGVLRSRPSEYAANATLFYSGYGDQPPQPAHLPSSNGQHQSSIELCSGSGSEFTGLCGSGQRTGQSHSPTAVTANDHQHRGAESNCTAGASAQSSAATYKWMTVKRGAPKSAGQSVIAPIHHCSNHFNALYTCMQCLYCSCIRQLNLPSCCLIA